MHAQRESVLLIVAILLVSCSILYHAYLPVEAAAGSDQTLWNVTINSDFNSNDDEVGWDTTASNLGSIVHHSPTTGNTFVVNGTTNTAKGLLYAQTTSTYFLVEEYISESDRDSTYITFGNKRCSFSTGATATWGGVRAHAWHNPPLADPLSTGASTGVAILYNTDYLTLNGPDTVTIPEGASYQEAGHATPDGAAVTSNATDLDTSVPGIHKIQYNATKGCGLLDTAIRTVEVQDAPPAFASASLDYRTRELIIIFNKKIDISATDLAKIYVSDAGRNNEVSLDGAAFDNSTSDSNMLYAMLDAGQMSRIMQMSTPQLDIEVGAVSDTGGTAIGDAPDGHIQVFDAGDDRTLWNATITAGYVAQDADVGWRTGSNSMGSIAYHPPTAGNTFPVNGTAYVVKHLYTESLTATHLVINDHIPTQHRDSLYIAFGEKRCSFDTTAGRIYLGDKHTWDSTDRHLLGRSAGAITDVAILYNSNYLTLNGDETVTVPQGANYTDAGAATPDGARISSNATSLDTAMPGTYKIQYTASKGCNTLDKVFRTVVVTDNVKPSFEYASLDYDAGIMTIAFDKTVDVSAVDLAKAACERCRTVKPSCSDGRRL